MSAVVIDGKAIAKKIVKEAIAECAQLKSLNITPTLAVTIVGDDPASHSYIRAKKRACREVGIETSDTHLPITVSQTELLTHLANQNNDPAIHAILVQLPLPKHINTTAIIRSIMPQKDIDGFHPDNVGLLMAGIPRFAPCTPLGIVRILIECNISISGAEIVIVGRSMIVGKPLALLLLTKGASGDATVTVAHSRTESLTKVTRRADVLIAASGVPKLITTSMVKPGAAVIDVGVNRVEDANTSRGYRLCGDVDFDAVKEIAFVYFARTWWCWTTYNINAC